MTPAIGPKKQLEGLGLIQGNEGRGISNVLGAAALTYVAAMVSSVLNLLQLILMSQNRSED
ncbi:MAG: zinc metallopeptidase [Verrucomicrobia bacterium]|nr:zinc metallopeptidase [Verrucomicrobiota bacterium]